MIAATSITAATRNFAQFTRLADGIHLGLYRDVAQRGFAASFQRSAFSDQLPICDKFAAWASWMFFSGPEVPEVQRLSADG
jgi:hypothetical protein